MKIRQEDLAEVAHAMGPQWRQRDFGWDFFMEKASIEVLQGGEHFVVSLKADAPDLPSVSRAELGPVADLILEYWNDRSIWLTIERMVAARAQALVSGRVVGFTGQRWVISDEQAPAEPVWFIVRATDYETTSDNGQTGGNREVLVIVVDQSGTNLGMGFDPACEVDWQSPEVRPPMHPPSAERPAAEVTSPVIQFIIAGLHFRPAPLGPEDANEAVRWLRKAADQGLAEAQYVLASCYEEGYGVPRDDRMACEWYGRAAAQGHPKAQFELGARCFVGRGLPRDCSAGAAWLGKAAERGNMAATGLLANCYMRGVGVEQDFARAYGLLLRAIEGGLPLDEVTRRQRDLLKALLTPKPQIDEHRTA